MFTRIFTSQRLCRDLLSVQRSVVGIAWHRFIASRLGSIPVFQAGGRILHLARRKARATCRTVLDRIYRASLSVMLLGWGTTPSGICQNPTSLEFDESIQRELVRYAPREPTEALRSFELAQGFELDLVAAEPWIVDPIAFCFDPRGRLFVIEMIDYSEQENDRLGRVALLEDLDGDGHMDRRSTFAEGLSWPTAIHAWCDGVIVIAPPELLFLRDTDDDGVSDQSEIWFTGFGRNNVQGMANSLRWTIEGYLEGSGSSNGGEIVDRRGKKISLRGRDFRLDPISQTITATSGGGQHGMCFNVWGDKFVTSNSDHLQQILDVESWMERETPSVPLPSTRRSIALEGPQADVYRISPIEPWRIVRTRLRVQGSVPGPIEGGGRAAGYFTGATGTWVMPADSPFGRNGREVAFVCDVGSNLVHRKLLSLSGLFYAAERIDANSEFLRSDDTWFRPVQLGDGPDGSLYVADMYREVIEHPLSLPPVIKRHLDLTSGRDRGRIYRVRPSHLPYKSPESLAQRSNRELAMLIGSPNSWQRLTAQQLLVERQASDVQEVLLGWAREHEHAPCRLLALATLRRLGMPSVEVCAMGLKDSDEHVVAASLRWMHTADQLSLEDPLGEILERFDSPRIDWELAKTMASCSPSLQARWMSRVLAKHGDPVFQALAGNLMAREPTFVLEWWNDKERSDVSGDQGSRVAWLTHLLPAWLRSPELQRQKETADPVADWIVLLRGFLVEAIQSPEMRSQVLDIASGLSTEEKAVFLRQLAEIDLTQLRAWIQDQLDSENLEPSLDSVVRWTWILEAESQQRLAQQWLHPRTEPNLLGRFLDSYLVDGDESRTTFVIESMQHLLPAQRRIAIESLLGHQRSSHRLVSAVLQQTIPRHWVESGQWLRMQAVASPDQASHWPAMNVMRDRWSDQRLADKARAIESILRDSDSGQIGSGREVFIRECAACHQFGGKGTEVGPSLDSVWNKSTEQLLMAILDPNREFDPRFEMHALLTADGKVISGVLASESSSSLEVRSAGGERHIIARSEVEQCRPLGSSLMPTDLDMRINDEELAALLLYLRQPN